MLAVIIMASALLFGAVEVWSAAAVLAVLFTPKTAFLFLAQIGGFETREQVLDELKRDKKFASYVEKFGVVVDEIGNKSFVIARSTCCKGPGEWCIGAFVPSNIDANIGDVVEIRLSQEEGGEHRMLNVVVAVRANQDRTAT